MTSAMLHYPLLKINARMAEPLISVAPMMGCTDRHFRYLLRLISPRALLYTEMVTGNDVASFIAWKQSATRSGVAIKQAPMPPS